jgi:uncharacterized protein involved in exopolysaccharide biosynthesis/Mrp family chromosome partitioning ATPase
MNETANRYMLVPASHGPVGEAMPGAVVDLRGIFGAARQRWRLIASCALVCGGLTAGVVYSLPARYDASAKVLLDPRGIQILQNDLRPNNTTGDETGAEVDSQVQVISSLNLLRKVAEQLDLQDDPEFTDPPLSLPAKITKSVQDLIGATPNTPPEPPLTRAIRTLYDSVSVRRFEKTFIIDIGVRTGDPQKSTRIANAIAEAFARETSSVRSDAARRSSVELTGQLESLRKKAERSDAAVEDYRKKADLVGAAGKLVTEQQLSDLNTQLTLARARAAEQQARVSEIQRMSSGGNPADAMSEVSNSAAMTALRGQYTDAARAASEARMNFGPRHPAYQNAEQQLQTVKSRINEEVNRLSRTAQSDYERARASVTSLTKWIDNLKRENATANDAQVQLRELQRVASADRSVYESFLNRAKDLDERKVLDNGNARIISQAIPPIGRSGVSRVIMVLAGLGFGAMLGLGLALLRDQAAAAEPVEPRRGERLPALMPAMTGLPMLTVKPSETSRDPVVREVRELLSPSMSNGQARLVVVTGLKASGARARLAQVLARLNNSEGERTLLIDGDFENRTLTKALHADGEPGFTDALANPDESQLPVPRSFDGLQVITAGTEAPGTGPLSVRALRQALEPYLKRAGLIVVDGGAIGGKVNAFAALADDILVVVEGGPTVQKDVSTALEGLSFNAECIRGVLIAQGTEAA